MLNKKKNFFFLPQRTYKLKDRSPEEMGHSKNSQTGKGLEVFSL